LIPGRRTAVQLSVRRDGLRMLVDGKPIIDWHGTAEQLGNESYYTNGFPSTLFVTTKTRFTIHRLTLTPLVPAPTPAAAPTIPAEILAFNGHRYLLVGDAAGDFASAETKAQAMGGHLATINSKEERDWVRDEIWLKRAKPANVHRCLLGGRIAPDRKSGTWVTGESIDFNLWDGDRQGPDTRVPKKHSSTSRSTTAAGTISPAMNAAAARISSSNGTLPPKRQPPAWLGSAPSWRRGNQSRW
jgi:hypothetical protein